MAFLPLTMPPLFWAKARNCSQDCIFPFKLFVILPQTVYLVLKDFLLKILHNLFSGGIYLHTVHGLLCTTYSSFILG